MQPGDVYQTYADIDDLTRILGSGRARALKRGSKSLSGGIWNIIYKRLIARKMSIDVFLNLRFRFRLDPFLLISGYWLTLC